MSLNLYHMPLSPNAIKVVFMLKHLGLTYNETIIDLTKGESHAPAYKAINPNGLIPAIEDDGFVLWESNAILLYLNEKHGGDLVPSDPHQKAQMHQWMAWQLAHWTPGIGGLTFERLAPGFFPGYQADAGAIERATEKIARFAPVIDAHLAGKQFLVGDKLTLADIAVASSMVHARMAQLPLDQFSNLWAWYSRIESLPAWKAAVPPMPVPAG